MLIIQQGVICISMASLDTFCNEHELWSDMCRCESTISSLLLSFCFT